MAEASASRPAPTRLRIEIGLIGIAIAHYGDVGIKLSVRYLSWVVACCTPDALARHCHSGVSVSSGALGRPKRFGMRGIFLGEIDLLGAARR